ncbi:MAG: hypothetical protein B6D65_03655 [candidate division Zixibacteria bacterium 4484_93]|nr:MAG: hypothetical protein B6D65_03655 [candidate division Zixibacteria bacterium 4484_93]
MKKEEEKFRFPKSIKKLSKEECAKILQKALASSNRFSSVPEVAAAVGISRQSVGDYFYGRNKPPQERWDMLRQVLFEEEIQARPKKELKGKELEEAKQAAERLKAITFLLKHELNYFQNTRPEVRQILKDYLPGPEAGRIAGLLIALYDEDQLEVWKTFSDNKE